ncbi:MAG: hypothetical protein GXP46_00755 [Deferribacteres bacterium]|nr:hypothetical protein [Deferribacteres bacterium]
MDITLLNTAMYLAVNLLLFSSWYLLLFRERDRLLFADRVTGAFIAGLAQIIATELVLGVVFRQLFAGPLFTLNVLISSGVLAAALRRHAGGLLRSVFAEAVDEAVRILKIITGDRALLCVFSLFVIMLCWMVFLGYLFPSYTWDSLWVHLPSVGYTLQNGAIQVNPAYSFIDIVVNVLPQNMELFFVWNVIFLKSSTLVDLSPLVLTLAGMLIIYGMAVKLGMRENHAIWASLLFFFTPVILLLSVSNYVDVPVAVLFLAAINFLMYGMPGYRAGNTGKVEKVPVLISGVATGILLGTKGSGPLFVAVLSIAIIIQEAVKHVKQYGGPLRPLSFAKKALMPYLVLFILPALLWGGYWYIKNWVVYNNPLYTTDISVMNVTIFKGLFKGIIDPAPEVITKLTPLGRLFYVWLERVPYYLYDSRLSGFGPMWFILFLPAAALAVLHAVKREEYGFLFVSAILVFTFVIYPRNWYTRYVIYIVALGPLSFGMTLDYFSRRAKILKAAALLLVCYTFLTANSPCIMPEKIREFIQLPPRERTIARLAPFNIDVHARQEYGYWTWISNNVREGDTLAYTFDPLFLTPLWNSNFSNRIIYIRADTYKAWLKELEKNNATYVVIKRNSTEGRWVEKRKKLLASFRWLGAKEKLKDVYADDNYMIMKVVKGE